MTRTKIAAALLGVGLALSMISAHSTTSHASTILPRALGATAATQVAGLPSHFGLGLAAHPDSSGIYGWMPNSGIPWDYAYQYLSGGVNTNSGWETWNSGGQFPLYYAQGAAGNHFIPVLTYYELLQSNGSCNSCGEAQKDLSNLNNTSTMASYFQNFTLLMQRLGTGTYNGIAGFGKTVIVHVEPDLSGHAEQAVLNNGSCYGYCTGQGNNPAYLNAAVGSSGVPDVSAYPNTYRGFNWALLHLRDLYAPNVLLAFHVSNWATATDISSDTSSSVDAASLGQEAGSFAAQSGTTGLPSGVKGYDLIFNDVSDRDAGYYKYVYNNPNMWWDRLNVTFPNFHRWETYVSGINAASGRPIMVWQIPEGNQYFDTENNTNGHYQDNRAEYLLGHISELVQSGIIGLLFGTGNAGSTANNDAMNDGVTNPASFCTTDGVSSGQICNNHVSTVSDDDGGYLRLEGQSYYASGGFPLSGPVPTSTPTPIPSSTPTRNPAATATSTPLPPLSVTIPGISVSSATVAPGGAETLSATVLSNDPLANALIDFEVYCQSGTTWNKVYQTTQSGVVLAANSAQTFSTVWNVPSSQSASACVLQAGVFSADWLTSYVYNSSGASFSVVAGASSPTKTPLPPTATATKTPLPPTATATKTPVPPTATATNTPLPPTATATHTATPAATSTAIACASGWTCGDIGAPALAGTQSVRNGVWTLQGAGSDIWNTADQGHGVWRPLPGDGGISAEMTGQTNTNSWAKAGVMLRASVDPHAAYYYAFVTPGNGLNVQYRSAYGQSAQASVYALTGGTPVYLRVARTGTTFTAYWSGDGVTWTAISGSTRTISGLSGSILAGLAMTAHNMAALGTATFASVGS